ncbi:MAG: YidB family protein [Betaproteobacteria bacterium]
MSLLDSVIGSLSNNQQGSSPLLQMAMQMLSHRGDGTGGGLGGLMDAFQNAGMGDQLKSWIGTGSNMPISADQLNNVLGSDKIRDIANQLGMSHGEVSGGLADMLPQLIDKLSPNGQLPDSHNMLQDALAGFLKR